LGTLHAGGADAVGVGGPLRELGRDRERGVDR
jgi:hypothetical protein